MRALTWQATGNVRVEDVPDPNIQEPTDAVIRVTSTAICGSDLHLYDVLGPFLTKGDVLGHEAMGVVDRVGSAVRSVSVGDRVVIPFVIACGQCFMCQLGLTTQCEATQNRQLGTGASLYGYTELYGSVPGGQAQYLRVPFADFNALTVGNDLPDECYLFLSDILPTAWQGVQYADLQPKDVLGVIGLGPVGQFASRIGRYLGHRVIAIEPIAERRALAERHGIETMDLTDDVRERVRDMTDGRGPAAVIDAVGMEAHGNPIAAAAQAAVGLLPDPAARKIVMAAGVDRLAALNLAIDIVRRGGVVSLSGVYGGNADPLPLMTLFDKHITLRMGQCNVHHWREELVPLVEDLADPLGVGDLVTHRASLEDAPQMYEMFKKKADGCVKVVLTP